MTRRIVRERHRHKYNFMLTEVPRNSHKRGWLIFFTVAFFFAAGILVGKTWQIKTLVSDDRGQVEIAKVLDLYSKTRSPEVKFDQFWDIWDKIKSKYVEQPVKDVDLFYGAVEGMVGGLNDPYSVYFPPTQAQDFVKDLAGAFEGIGAAIGMEDNQLVVIAPIQGSPAEKAGLKPGDQIYKINGEEAFGLKVDEAVQKIRGPKGTEVKLTIGRKGEDKVLEITIVRDVITVPTVTWEKKENQIVYLRVSYFNGETWDQFDKAVKEIQIYKPKGIVLDLRSDPGGYLDTAVAIASEWIKQGDIVKERFNDGEENKYPTIGKHRLAGIKTIVLVDENSASASEIVAGALQDYGLATLLGNKTYGKGSVQDFEILPDGSALKLTVARWFTPKDRQIEKLGIVPDVEMKEMFVRESDAKDAKYKDVGLEKALELLK